MNSKEFWAVIAASQSDSQDEQAALLEAKLTSLSKTELIGFEHQYSEKLAESFHWDLWAGAYLINGGCSDDGFDYFCDWLISRGEDTYTAALKNPETLIGKATPWNTEFESFRYIMMDVIEEVHNDDFPNTSPRRPAQPAGEPWDEDTVEQKYPKLAAWAKTEGEKLSQAYQAASAQQAKQSLWQRLFGKK